MAKKAKKKNRAIKRRTALKKSLRRGLGQVKKLQKKRKKILVKKKAKKKKIVRKNKRKAPKKVKLSENISEFSPQSFFKAKIKVIGIGGGGSSIVSEIGRSLHKATFVTADTDVRAFKKRPGIKQFLFGQELTHGLGTGLNTDLAKAAAEAEKEKIAKLFEGQDIVILIACLGGGLSSGAGQVFAEVAKNFGGISFGIFTLPFRFEGKNKYAIAQKALRQLRPSLSVSITIPNERIFKIIEPNTAITDAFSIVNKSLIESLESLIDLIYSPGVINIDFADLKAILQGTGNLAFLNTLEASGQDRAQKIAENILQNPLYQNNNFTVQKVLFNIASSGNVSMFEVDKISRAIAKEHERAKIIFGLSKDAHLKNKIKTTLLMTGPAKGIAPAPVLKPKVTTTPVAKRVAPAKKVARKAKKVSLPKIKNVKKKMKPVPRKIPALAEPIPIFNIQPVFEDTTARVTALEENENQKKAIRRSALEVKEAEALEESKKSEQEKEWEIPAFLRVKKIK